MQSSRIMDQLGMDFVYRKHMKWPLVNEEEWIKFKDDSAHGFLELKSYTPDWMKLEKFDLNKFRQKFTFLQPILDKFKGKILAAGGFYSTPKEKYNFCDGQDVDFFIHSCNEDEATQILREAVIFITSNAFKQEYIPKLQNISHTKIANVTIEHSLNVVNVIINYNKNNNHEGFSLCVKYQFILRLYPRPDLILGGFDLSASAVGYDGTNIFATPMGAYCFANKRIIIDISRRSTTFSKRLAKYRTRGFSFVFPGFPKDVRFGPSEHDRKQAIKQIKELTQTFHLEFKAYDYSWDYGGRSEMPTKLSLDKAFKSKDTVDLMDFTIYVNDGAEPSGVKAKTPNIQDRLLADYDFMKLECTGTSNLFFIMNGKKEYTFSYITIEKLNNIEGEVDDFLFETQVIEVDKIIDFETFRGSYMDEERQLKYFGIFGKELKNMKLTYGKNSAENKYNLFKEKVDQYREDEIKAATEALKGIKWITKNPGRQWTSSVNPAIVKAVEFYGEKYQKIGVILSEEVEILLRLGRKDGQCVLSWLPKDMFTYIIELIPFV